MRTTLSEARYTTPDGRIWPVTRDRMASARDVGDRMVQDIAALVDEGGDEAVDLRKNSAFPPGNSRGRRNHWRGCVPMILIANQ